jgi:hypothetical protein
MDVLSLFGSFRDTAAQGSGWWRLAVKRELHNPIILMVKINNTLSEAVFSNMVISFQLS